MTVPSPTNKWGPYSCNGSTTAFAYLGRIFAASQLAVYLRDPGGVETLLTLGVHYTVSGVNDPAGGAIVTSTAYGTGYTISILRVLPLIQETDLVNQGPFYAETMEDQFDRIVMMVQQLSEGMGRTLQMGVTDAPPTGRWDAHGSRIINVGDGISSQDAVTKAQVSAWLAAIGAPARTTADLPWYPVANKAELEAALMQGYRYIGIYGEIQGGVEIDIENVLLCSFMPPEVPVFRATGPGQTLLKITGRNSALIGHWSFRGYGSTPETVDTTALDIAAGTDTLMFGPLHFLLCRRAINIMPTGAEDVRYVYFSHLKFDRISEWCLHLFGAETANVVTYVVVDKIDANTQDIAFVGDVIKIGDNVGSGGSPGFICFWPMLYRYAKQVHIYCTAAPLQGINTGAPRKLYFFNASLRGAVSDALVIEDGDEITFFGLTLDDSDGKNAYIGPDFVGQYRVYNLVSKDAWYEGWHHDAPMSGFCEINGIEVSNNSYRTARTGQFVFTGNPAPGDTATVTVGANSLTVTFVAASPIGDQVLIGATQDDTLSNLAAFLDASSNPAVSAVVFTTDLAADTLYLRLYTGGFNPECTASSAAITASTPGIVNSTPGVYSGVRIHPSTRHMKISNGMVGVGASWRKQTGTIGNNGANVVAGNTYTLAGIAFQYVASGATGNQINVGATAAESLANAFAVLIACPDPTIRRLRFQLDAANNNINIQGDFWDQAYAGLITIGITPLSNMTRSNTVLSGGTGTPSQKYGIEYGGAPAFYGEGLLIENVRLEGNVLGGTNYNQGTLLSHHNGFTTEVRDPTIISAGVTGGTSSAQTLAVGYGLAPLAAGDMIRFTPGLSSTGSPTLAISCKSYLIATLPMVMADGSPAALISGRPVLATVGPNAASLIIQHLGIAAPPQYEEGSWTPVPTFATPGDLAVTSSTLVGRYRRIGNMVECTCEGSFTPTFTTASGDFRITGLPFVSFTTGMGDIGDQNQRFTYTGAMKPRVPAGQSYINLRLLASASAAANLGASGMSSTNAHTLALAVKYWISA